MLVHPWAADHDDPASACCLPSGAAWPPRLGCEPSSQFLSAEPSVDVLSCLLLEVLGLAGLAGEVDRRSHGVILRPDAMGTAVVALRGLDHAVVGVNVHHVFDLSSC